MGGVSKTKSRDLERIRDLEEISSGFEVSPSMMSQWLAEVGEFSSSFLSNIKKENAYYEDQDRDSESYEKLPTEGSSFKSVIEDFHNRILSNGVNTASGKFFGYIPGGGVPTAAIGDYLAALTNRYSGAFFASPGAARMENQCIRWLSEMIEYPETSWGTLQSGGTLATLTALLAMRENCMPADRSKNIVYLTDQTHHGVSRSLNVLGFRREQIRILPTDSDGRFNIEKLKSAITADKNENLIPTGVVATAGTTNTGVIDPLPQIATISRENNLWLHVDAAYGGFFMLVSDLKRKFACIDQADSIVLDPHKGLFLPYGTGAVLIKNGKHLLNSFQERGAYMDHLDETFQSPANCSPELTRHFRACRLWFTLKLHGVQRFRAALEEKWRLANYAYDALSNFDQIEIGKRPELTTFVFRAKERTTDSKTATQQLAQQLSNNADAYLSSTEIGGNTWIRFCILSFRSHLKDVDAAIATIKRFLEAR